MIKKIKTLLTSLAALLIIAVPATVPVAVYAADTTIQNGLCQGANLQIGDTSGCNNDTANQQSLNNLLTKIVNIFSIVVGVIAVIMIIVGGLRYITSGGDAGKVGTAKNSIIYAIVGLVIVALAQFIVHYVLANANNLT
jgi:hypothetical protein